jgi:hypothetical protein
MITIAFVCARLIRAFGFVACLEQNSPMQSCIFNAHSTKNQRCSRVTPRMLCRRRTERVIRIDIGLPQAGLLGPAATRGSHRPDRRWKRMRRNVVLPDPFSPTRMSVLSLIRASIVLWPCSPLIVMRSNVFSIRSARGLYFFAGQYAIGAGQIRNGNLVNDVGRNRASGQDMRYLGEVAAPCGPQNAKIRFQCQATSSTHTRTAGCRARRVRNSLPS